ncbi:MAG: MBL fold metallo-hydrolase [Rhodococcus sp.]|nr:MBL fold metallo-hydrolase [Rhodococcus sp. (in: high G+C Gram-positive bacteria)]
MNSISETSSGRQSRGFLLLTRRAWILDVGHGSATVVEDPPHVSVIDGGRGDTLLRFLAEQGITHVDTVLVSHVDVDHFGGISLLLSNTDVQVGRVLLNPDARETELWRDFVSVMIDAKGRGAAFELELTDASTVDLGSGNVRLDVLAPSQELAIRTANGRTTDDRQLTPNAMSAVVRIWSEGVPRVLVAGDIDHVGLESLRSNNSDVRADVLVFPHHGGRPGRSDPSAFAEALTRAVEAKLVVFSIGRGRYGTPRPEIVAAVLRASRDVHIACTQLSEHCAADLPTNAPDLHAAFSRGTATNACCAGSIEVLLEPGDSDYYPSRRAHLGFIRTNAPTALCRRAVSEPSSPIDP